MSSLDESSTLTLNTKLGAPRYNLEKLTKTSRSTSNTSNRFTIVALTEGRGADKGTIGMSCMDLRHSDLTLCEFFDSRSYTMLKTRLMIVDPLEIIVPEVISEKNNHMKVMLDVIRSSLKNTKITEVQRRFFNDSKGTEVVQQLGAPECCNIDTTVVKKNGFQSFWYYCLSAAYAVVKYVEYIQNILFAQKSLSITYEAIDDCCLIDVNSWSNLDLIDVGQRSTKGNDRTLFAILNRCVTVGGSKYLRSCLLQPSADINLIEERLDLVQEFVSNQAMLDRVRSLLANLNDLQVLISICVSKSQSFSDNREESVRSIRSKITQIVGLKRMLLVVSTMQEVFQPAHSPWIIKNRAKLCDSRLQEICDIIDEKIDDTVLLKKASGSMAAKDSALFAVRGGLHILLDLARKTYAELVDSIKTIGIEEQEKVQGCILTYSFSRGYHLSLNAKDPLTVLLPPHCMQIMRHRSSVTYTTRDLIRYNDRLKQSENEILIKSNILVDQLIGEIRQNLPALHKVVEFLTQLDFITALGSYSVVTKCVRPKIDTELKIRNGRHPILDVSEPVVIPNDTYIVPSSRFIIITGPNMAGKSTYMKQVCLLQILAQLGCFVPADFATFAPMQRIFSRVGHNDDITRNLSAFALEMNEMAIILPHANERSLIVIDELARSTSTEEGMGMCYSICEQLINCKAFVLFATHFLDLSSLELSFPAVQNYHFYVQSTIDTNGKEVLHPSHKLYKGPYKGPLYGFELAELTTFPQSLLQSAREMAEKMRSDVYLHQLSHCENDTRRKKKLAYIAHRILQIIPLIQDDNTDKVAEYLSQLREKAVEENLPCFYLKYKKNLFNIFGGGKLQNAPDWLLCRKAAVFGAVPVGLGGIGYRRTSRVSASSFDQIIHSGNSMRFDEDGERANIFFPTRHSLNACLGTCANGINDNIRKQKLKRASFLNKLAIYLQIFYEKSRLRYIFPIIVLVAYSFIGGFIFYTIENPEEQKTLMRKKEYIQKEEAVILREILEIEQRIHSMYQFYNSTELRINEIKRYRSFAINRLNKAIYWYVLQIYYLNDQESYKTSLLHPNNPENLWRTHFSTNFGRIYALKNYTQQLSDRCWEIGIDRNNLNQTKKKLDEAIVLFNQWTGLDHVLTPTWTFWNSMFLAVTTYTTIGYGNITASSRLGKLAVMIYAVIGIPLVLMILHRLGSYFLLMLQKFWDFCIWLMEVSCVKNADRYRTRLLGEERETGMPVWLAIGIAGGWMFLCSAIFLKFEKDWDYFKSFYFFFCSLTTIGYGDVTPTNSEDMFIIFGFIIIGLSLVSMCINVVQLKLENLFEELLMTILEEYGASQGEGGIIDAEEIREKIGLIDLLKMWKRKRKARERQRRETIAAVGAEVMMEKNIRYSLPHDRRKGRLADLKELKKIFPFMAKRRREVLLQQFHTKLHQVSKSTQTDGNGAASSSLFYHEIRPLSVAHEIDEVSFINTTVSDPTNNETSLKSSSNEIKIFSSSSSSTTTTGSGPHSSKSVSRLHVTINDRPSSSSSSSSYARRYLPSRSERRATPTSACSAQSAPNVAPGPSSSMAGAEAPYSGVRRWTFFEIGKTPRGAPRGLVIPYMYMKPQAKKHETTEVKRLIAELDARLLQCRTLISPCSRSVSRASRRTAASEGNSSRASSLRNISPLTKDSH